MISYEEALKMIAATTTQLAPVSLLSKNALDHVLAENLVSPVNLPSFANTAMDGFSLATRGHELPAGTEWDVLGEQAAGDGKTQASEGAWEIMTGARIPDGFDAVIPIEQVQVIQFRHDGRPARIRSIAAILPGQHVRHAGEDIALGEIAMEAGERLEPQHIMLLAGLGIREVLVTRPPRIALICTGRELIDDVSQPLIEGQIRNSNGPFLLARIAAAGAVLVHYETVSDEPDEFIASLKKALSLTPDIVISTGAVSMGRYDFIPDALLRENAEILFHKVAIRPGKPLLYARLAGGQLYFGLPGNPVSSAVGLRFFVEAAIRIQLGLPPERSIKVPIKSAMKKKAGFRFHQKAKLEVGSHGQLQVSVLSGQESFRIRPLLQANAWVVLHESAEHVAVDGLVDVFGLGHREFPFNCENHHYEN